MAKKKIEDVYSGVYQHYKGGLYLVLGVAQHTETDEILMTYIPLYTQEDHKGPRLRVRPLKMFLEKITINGKKIPRFKYLGPELV